MKTAHQLVNEALAEVHSLSVDELRARLAAPALRLLDIREAEELVLEGTIPGALHVPRGLLEFRIDPASPWVDAQLAAGAQQWVLFCGVGWRSALAAKTLQDMGLAGVSHLGGGFRAWVAAGGPVEPWTQKE